MDSFINFSIKINEIEQRELVIDNLISERHQKRLLDRFSFFSLLQINTRYTDNANRG